MARRKDVGPWPHGRPTIVCPHCHGTGLSSSLAAVYVTTRVVVAEPAREAAVRCTLCDGRGRLTPEHALAQGVTPP